MAGNDSNVDRYKDNVSHDEPNIPSEWLASGYDVSNISTQIISPDNSVVEASSIHSAPVLNYSCLPIWGDQFIDVHSLRYNTNVESNASSSSSFSGIRAGVNWMPNAMIRDVMFMPATSGMLPQSLPPLPTDSTDPDFIESTARFSCFSGGTFNDILRPFSFPNSLDPSSIGYMPKQGDIFTDDGLNPSPVIEARSMIVGELKNVEETGVDESADHCEEAEFSRVDAQRNLAGTSVESSIRGVGMKKRKRTKQKPENQKDDKVSQPDAEKPSFTSDEIRQKGKLIDKFGKETKRNDPPEEGHIHVRARRDQATNSHSLAERIRREKISERMKYLQDLVPGCNKVMGKAVMLDEIINYVQSMQRQVELLSMKLATLNPQLEFNTEELVANDILQSGDGLSSSLAFPPGITMLLPSPSRQNQASLPGKRNSSMQVGLDLAPGVWDAALHNVVHNSLGSYSDPLSTQICRYPF